MESRNLSAGFARRRRPRMRACLEREIFMKRKEERGEELSQGGRFRLAPGGGDTPPSLLHRSLLRVKPFGGGGHEYGRIRPMGEIEGRAKSLLTGFPIQALKCKSH